MYIFKHCSLRSAASLASYDVWAGTLCLLQSIQTTMSNVQLVWFVQSLIIFKFIIVTVHWWLGMREGCWRKLQRNVDVSGWPLRTGPQERNISNCSFVTTLSLEHIAFLRCKQAGKAKPWMCMGKYSTHPYTTHYYTRPHKSSKCRRCKDCANLRQTLWIFLLADMAKEQILMNLKKSIGDTLKSQKKVKTILHK